MTKNPESKWISEEEIRLRTRKEEREELCDETDEICESLIYSVLLMEDSHPPNFLAPATTPSATTTALSAICPVNESLPSSLVVSSGPFPKKASEDIAVAPENLLRFD